HGRFHAFDLARGLLGRGHEVSVFTNYPIWVTRRFGLPKETVRSFWPHGVLSRGVEKIFKETGRQTLSPFLHRMFGSWAATEVRSKTWDLIHTFSGVAEEILQHRNPNTIHFIVRGSSHIRTQDDILRDEEARCGQRIERPIDWMIAREQREYELCDRIVVLSTFAYKSFVAQGTNPEKLILVPLGVDTARFRASAEDVERRRHRILNGEPLTVLFTGNL